MPKETTISSIAATTTLRQDRFRNKLRLPSRLLHSRITSTASSTLTWKNSLPLRFASRIWWISCSAA